jgi:hypothetical protein
MGTDNSFLFLILLITAVAIGLRMNVFVTLFLSFVALGITILLSIHSVLAATPFVLLSFVFGFLAASRYLFNKRVAAYIAEGQRILIDYSTSTLSTVDYVDLVRSWQRKVSEDIQHHKGQAEDFVMLEATIQEFEKGLDKSSDDATRRNLASQIVGTQLRQLKGLRL